MEVESSDLVVEMQAKACVSVAALSPDASVHGGDRIEEGQGLLDIATDFRKDGWPDKARRFARRALSIFERESGTDPRDIVRALLCLGGAREDLADHTRAKAEYLRAGDVLDRSAESADDHDVQTLRIQMLRGLASVMLAQGQDCEAETLLKHALSVAQQTLGPESSDVATVLDDLGVLYSHTGLHEEASRQYHLALAISEKALRPEHPQTATILHHLGLLEHARGRFAVGEPFARRSAAIRRKIFGRDHPQVAASLASIAALLEGQRKHAEAKLMNQRAHTILHRWFGRSDEEAVGTEGHLARTVAAR